MSQKWIYFAAGIVIGRYVVPIVMAKVSARG